MLTLQNTQHEKYLKKSKEYKKYFQETGNTVLPGDYFFQGISHDDFKKFIKVKSIKNDYVEYEEWNWETNTWVDDGDSTQFEYLCEKATKHPLEYIEEAKKAMESGDVSKYMSPSSEEKPDTQLMHISSKDTLSVLKSDLEEKHSHISLVRQTMTNLIELQKEKLLEIREKLDNSLQIFYKQIEKINRCINTIEVYLGIEEELYQIQSGEPATKDDPICIRQGLMYMDEEVGDPWDDGQGIEWKDISVFGEWLTRNSNYKKVVPEKKCIAAFQCRREVKDRGKNLNPYVKMMMENQDRFTFLLIRNGDNLYRIITDKIEFKPRLFPKRDELQKLFDMWTEVDDIQKKEGRDYIDYESTNTLQKKYKDVYQNDNYTSDASEMKDKINNEVFFYKMRFVLFQGLIERTEIFNPVPEPIKFFDTSFQDRGLIRLIYDDELCLPGNKKPFWDWIKDINSKITFGSRIVLTHGYSYKKSFYELRDFKDRFDDRFTSDQAYTRPKNPEEGLYVVQKSSRKIMVPTVIDNDKFDPSLPETNFRPNYIPGLDPKNDFDSHYVDDETDTSIFKHRKVEVKRNPKQIHKHILKYDSIVHHNMINSTITETSVKRPKFEYHEEIEYFMTIKYNPKDTVGSWGWEYNPHERKNSLSWKIYKEDDFLINYDLLTIEDIDFYLNSRIDRRHYIYMMPILNKVKEILIKEKSK